MPPTLFLLKITLALQGLGQFCMAFRTVDSISVKGATGIFTYIKPVDPLGVEWLF